MTAPSVRELEKLYRAMCDSRAGDGSDTDIAYEEFADAVADAWPTIRAALAAPPSEIPLTEEAVRAYWSWVDDGPNRTGKLDSFHAGWCAASKSAVSNPPPAKVVCERCDHRRRLGFRPPECYEHQTRPLRDVKRKPDNDAGTERSPSGALGAPASPGCDRRVAADSPASPTPAADAEVAGRLRAIYTVVSSGRQRPLSVPEQVAIKEAANTIDALTAERDELRGACTVLRAMLDQWHNRGKSNG